MEEDEDDFYGEEGSKGGYDAGHPRTRSNPPQDSRMDDDEDSEEDSDDDVEFTLERPPDAKPEPKSRFKREATPQQPIASTEPKESRASPAIKQESRTSSAAPSAAAVKGSLTHRGKEGKDFPEVRTSKIDVGANPTWPATGKPITEVDLDADLAENSQLWRLPGTDQTDFFNYGFDEYTWAQYCLRHQTIPAAIADQKQQDAQMKAMFGGGGANGNSGANPGMPPGMPPMPGMPGMPSPEEFFQQMMSSGMNPNDPDQFMQMMMSNGMPGMPGMPGGGQQGQQQGGGFGGPNQNQKISSPHPQAGQGFQPPTGPSNPQGDQGGFPPNMEGYSPQQLAIMQQQGGGMGGAPTGPTGPRRGGRRGRGFY